ncbi:MAG TPA: pentapeptide repeat-containing protein [Trichocoleus sp.]
MAEDNLLSENLSSDLSFSEVSNYAVPMDIHTLLMEYADGRRGFNRVELKQANLYKAKLTFIHLNESNLYKADLRYVNLAGASLNHADLSSSNLANANCIGADMIRVKLAGADLSGALLSGANLSGANLRRTNLENSSLAGANLSGADFSGAILKNTNLEDANLRGANLTEVDLADLEIENLDLEGAILTESQARLWESTQKANFPNPYNTHQEEALIEEVFQDGFSAEYATHDFYQLDYQNGIDGSDAYEISGYALAHEAHSCVEVSGETTYTYSFVEPLDSEKARSSLVYLAEEEEAFANSIDYFAVTTESFEPVPDGIEQQNSPEYYETGTCSQDEETLALQIETASEETTFLLAASASDATSEAQADLKNVPKAKNNFGGTAETVLLDWNAKERKHFGTQETFTFVSKTSESAATYSSSANSPSVGVSGLPTGDSARAKNSTNVSQSKFTSAENLNSTQESVRISPKGGASIPHSASQASQNRLRQAQGNQVVQSIQSVLKRRVQYSLQQKLLEVYNYQCAITQCPIRPLLETTLITGSGKVLLDHPSNGLVLRSDLKTLYDLHLLAIHPDNLTVLLSPTLLKTDYAALKGRKISVPVQQSCKPNPGCLKHHLLACKWYFEPDIATNQGANQKEDGLLPFIPCSLGRLKTVFQHPRKLALALGTSVACTALAGVLWFSAGKEQHVRVAGFFSSSQTQEASSGGTNAISLKTGSIVYRHVGLILEDSAYLPTSLASKLGITLTEIPRGETEEYQGKSYFKVSYLKTLGIGVDWNAGSRTVSLGCCSNSKIQPINLNINERKASSGIIVDNSAYIPVTTLEQLELDKAQIQESTLLEYDNILYLKVVSLKELSVQSQWDVKTRTLFLRR